MKYKLIAIDMDGTLLNSQNKISKRNIETLYKVIEKEMYVALSTGRILKSALYYSRSLQLSSSIVACNGAVVSLNGERDILYENALDIEIAENLIRLAEKNHIYYHFYDMDTFYSRILDEDVVKNYRVNKNSLNEQQIKFKVLNDPLKFLNDQVPKIYKFVFIEEDKDKLVNFRESLKQIEGIDISSSWYNNVEAMSKGVSKGEGLKRLCKRLNIETSQVIAIGDNENDISMFQVAGLAIAMENGDDIAKEHSHVITDTNDEDGVSKAIEKYALNV
ncbi:hypothetical protein EDD65_10380 [Keratinibaculum paraultunense]|uniref:Cof subfamily protein (Haloacid dehalogenase superfamily)/HAD superfamily hydrolase (TIGR01484 family) n=1 Tax=Keratinibaculum paraultunense TaxID=1278232 RepID=A0A4R3L187_9FIRM|nr:Cof-type HAD-IIB family hydrolase [Keratinibaculum paraultunense]QQY80260.1 HAD family phosphatase [Keratinibaculum paraultunense]TCS90773.1 hypothetical protein EDD65_10380 [Keratinibaculum paraultunense]